MSNFWLCCTVLYWFSYHFAVLEAVLECSTSHACRGDVIRCQCHDDPATGLNWVVLAPGETTRLFSQLYHADSPVGSPTTMGDYSAILNSTDPLLSSQLSITLSESAVTVQCDTSVRNTTTLLRIDGKQHTHMVWL